MRNLDTVEVGVKKCKVQTHYLLRPLLECSSKHAHKQKTMKPLPQARGRQKLTHQVISLSVYSKHTELSNCGCTTE